jgi:DNA-directed RNA polymerase specialized sigma subunit
MLPQTSRSKLDKFIERVAYRANKNYPSRYQDIDDYLQVGRMTLWQAEQSWSDKGDRQFIAYACLAIVRAIRRAAIQSTCAVSGSFRAKVQAVEIQTRLHRGETEIDIQRDFVSVKRWGSNDEWIALRGMFRDADAIH